MAGAIFGTVAASLFVAGAIFADVAVSLLAPGAIFGDVAVSLFVAGAVFGEIRVDSPSAKCCIFQYTMRRLGSAKRKLGKRAGAR